MLKYDVVIIKSFEMDLKFISYTTDNNPLSILVTTIFLNKIHNNIKSDSF